MVKLPFSIHLMRWPRSLSCLKSILFGSYPLHSATAVAIAKRPQSALPCCCCIGTLLAVTYMCFLVSKLHKFDFVLRCLDLSLNYQKHSHTHIKVDCGDGEPVATFTTSLKQNLNHFVPTGFKSYIRPQTELIKIQPNVFRTFTLSHDKR